MDNDQILAAVWQIAEQAGEAVMAVYATDFEVRHKDDRSPVTEADLAADRVIVPALQGLMPDVPAISEERVQAGETAPSTGLYWLIDPLDGTKEFVSRNGEFTVNIALIDGRGRPVLGVVHAPALASTWGACEQPGGPAVCLAADNGGPPLPIETRVPPPEGLTIFGSRSHADDAAMQAFLADRKVAKTVAAGSSLKFCRIAEGSGDVYPRFGPTCEWDTAAGHAVLLAAGGRVETVDGEPLGYGKPDFLNPHFIAWGR